jgi:chaperone protein EcpD
MNKNRRRIAVAACLGALLGGVAQASVTIGGTRVVYPLDQREVTVKLNNDSSHPALVQVWIDDGRADASPADIKVPFIITPPIFRMDAGKSQTLRVMYGGEPLPQDRETVYWLNVLDIPPKVQAEPDRNTLQLAYRTRIKMFVRPLKLPGTPEDAPQRLEWRIVHAQADGNGDALAISNPTAYHVSFSELQVVADGRRFNNETGGMVAPYGRTLIAIPPMSGVHAGRIHYMAISDLGGPIEGDADATD